VKRIVLALLLAAATLVACDRFVDLTPGIDAQHIPDAGSALPDAPGDAGFPFPDAANFDASTD
jgi:hypothetical protein